MYIFQPLLPKELGLTFNIVAMEMIFVLFLLSNDIHLHFILRYPFLFLDCHESF